MLLPITTTIIATCPGRIFIKVSADKIKSTANPPDCCHMLPYFKNSSCHHGSSSTCKLDTTTNNDDYYCYPVLEEFSLKFQQTRSIHSKPTRLLLYATILQK
jgi:hypothetical protein